MNRPARTSLLLAVVLAVGLGTGYAQRPKSPVAAQPGPWANKFFMPGVERDPTQPAPRVLVHDFGTVPFGTVCSQKFSITNPYDVPMQVLDVRVECGCLKSYPPTKVLQANESGEFAVSMDAGKFKGANAKKMFVAFGPNFVSTAELEFRAVSREDVTLTPGLVDFGIVAQASKVKPQTVVLKYDGRQKDWKVTDVVRPAPGLEVACKELSRSGPFAVTYHVTVTLKDDAPAGVLADPVVLKTNDPTTPFLTVHVAATVQPPVAVIPEKVTFRDSAVGTERQYKVLVRGSGGTLFTLKADVGDADGLRVEGILPAATNLHVVAVKYTPKAAGPFRHEVQLRTSLGGAPLVLVVEGEAK